MSSDRDTTRIVRSWLEEGATALPDRVLDAVLDQVPATSQRRPLWSAWRFRQMNSALKLGLAATAFVVVALVGITLLPKDAGVGTGPSPTATPTASPTATPQRSVVPSPTASQAVLTEFPQGPFAAGTYTVEPFTSPDSNVCPQRPKTGCIEPDQGDSLRFTVTVPPGWTGLGSSWIFAETTGADTADLLFNRGGWLLTDPCQTTPADVPVGPTVENFVDALAAHPILNTTTPVDVTLAGYSGKYLELRGPAVVSTEASPDPKCLAYRPWDTNIYMQGPNQTWHLWVLDIDGARVVIQAMDYPGTPDARRAEREAMVASIKIEP